MTRSGLLLGSLATAMLLASSLVSAQTTPVGPVDANYQGTKQYEQIVGSHRMVAQTFTAINDGLVTSAEAIGISASTAALLIKMELAEVDSSGYPSTLLASTWHQVRSYLKFDGF